MVPKLTTLQYTSLRLQLPSLHQTASHYTTLPFTAASKPARKRAPSKTWIGWKMALAAASAWMSLRHLACPVTWSGWALICIKIERFNKKVAQILKAVNIFHVKMKQQRRQYSIQDNNEAMGVLFSLYICVSETLRIIKSGITRSHSLGIKNRYSFYLLMIMLFLHVNSRLLGSHQLWMMSWFILSLCRLGVSSNKRKLSPRSKLRYDLFQALFVLLFSIVWM